MDSHQKIVALQRRILITGAEQAGIAAARAALTDRTMSPGERALTAFWELDAAASRADWLRAGGSS